MSVSITIRSAAAAYNALAGVATIKQQRRLVNFIIWSGDITTILKLLDHRLGGEMMFQTEFTNRQLRRIVETIHRRGTLSQVMDCLTNLPAEEQIAQLRSQLLDRLLRGSIKVWLKGDRTEFNVHSHFRKAKFLPAEVELMVAKVKRLRNHEYIDALADFRVGMLTNAQWEGLQHMAAHFHRLKEAREQKKRRVA